MLKARPSVRRCQASVCSNDGITLLRVPSAEGCFGPYHLSCHDLIFSSLLMGPYFVTPAWPRLADRLVRKTAVFVSPVRIRLDNAGNASIAPLRVEGPCETDIATPFHRRVPRTPRVDTVFGRLCGRRCKSWKVRCMRYREFFGFNMPCLSQHFQITR